jgi:hypothetical protein
MTIARNQSRLNPYLRPEVLVILTICLVLVLSFVTLVLGMFGIIPLSPSHANVVSFFSGFSLCFILMVLTQRLK